MNQERRIVVEPRLFGEVDEVLAVSPAAKTLYDIWYKYCISAKTPDDAANRKRWLKDWSASISPDEATFLDTPVREIFEGRKQEVGWGYFVRRKAEEDAEAEMYRRKRASQQTAPSRPVSKGERLNARRTKAQERRGTKPKTIH